MAQRLRPTMLFSFLHWTSVFVGHAACTPPSLGAALTLTSKAKPLVPESSQHGLRNMWKPQNLIYYKKGYRCK